MLFVHNFRCNSTIPILFSDLCSLRRCAHSLFETFFSRVFGFRLIVEFVHFRKTFVSPLFLWLLKFRFQFWTLQKCAFNSYKNNIFCETHSFEVMTLCFNPIFSNFNFCNNSSSNEYFLDLFSLKCSARLSDSYEPSLLKIGTKFRILTIFYYFKF